MKKKNSFNKDVENGEFFFFFFLLASWHNSEHNFRLSTLEGDHTWTKKSTWVNAGVENLLENLAK